jgi:P27 family predicted phage terminase small subunit
MGARGPQPTPTATLQARGSWRAKERDGEVQFGREAPSCPAHLKDEARREWKRQVKALDAAGILACVDRALLAIYCQAWGDYCSVCGQLAESGVLVKINGATRLNPLLKVRDRAADRVVQVAAHFGFSPAARTRLKAPPEPPAERTGKLRFFDGAGTGGDAVG